MDMDQDPSQKDQRDLQEACEQWLSESAGFYEEMADQHDSLQPLLWKANPDQLKQLQTNLLTMRSHMVINMDRLRKANVDGAQPEWEVMNYCVERLDARLSQIAKYLDIESEDSLIIQEMLEAHYSPEELGKTEAKKNGVWARLFRWLGSRPQGGE